MIVVYYWGVRQVFLVYFMTYFSPCSPGERKGDQRGRTNKVTYIFIETVDPGKFLEEES